MDKKTAIYMTEILFFVLIPGFVFLDLFMSENH